MANTQSDNDFGDILYIWQLIINFGSVRFENNMNQSHLYLKGEDEGVGEIEATQIYNHTLTPQWGSTVEIWTSSRSKLQISTF